MAYTYDSADRITSLTYPSGRVVTYIRDGEGRITSVTTKKNSGAPVVTLASSLTYQPMSRIVKSFTYGNGLTQTDTVTLDYETARLLLQNVAVAVIDRTHARTDLLNLTGITDAVTPANSMSFAYTPANRLSSATGPWGALSWSYDGVGNRLTEVAGATRTYAYPATSNKLTSVTEGVTLLHNNTYDNAGNLLTDVRSGITTAYTYNKRNRLATVTVGGNLKGTYTYNAAEQLVKRVLTNMTPSGTTHFVHDLMGNVIAETNGVATGTVREYIWLPETQIAPVMAARAQVDRPLAVVDAVNTASPVTWWVTPDHLNRPVLMTDAAKAQVWQAVWKPFGETQSLTGPAALDTRFPGQWFQIESGLHYNWHRHYDPTTGRYTQPDPLGFVDGPGVYGYVSATPLQEFDYEGLMPKKYEKPKNPNQRKGAEGRKKSGARERNVKHPNAEEHNIKKKGPRAPRGGPRGGIQLFYFPQIYCMMYPDSCGWGGQAFISVSDASAASCPRPD